MTERPAARFVGTIHLLPLPGSARGGTAAGLTRVLDAARRDAAAYAAGGASALIVENFGDVPFCRDRVGAHVVAAMTLATAAALAESGLPTGVNILRNDVLSAVAVAAMAGGSFVRANVYAGAAVTDQGIIEGRADEVQDLIKLLGAEIAVWADVDVKHAAPLAPRPLADLAEDAILRGLARAVIVTGRATGQPVSLADLQEVRQAVPDAPLYAGSGVTAATAGKIGAIADGVIVGSAAKIDGDLANPVAPARVRAIIDALNG